MKGFSLVEVLVALAIMMTVGVVVLSIFFLSLRGTNKSSGRTDVRENGEFVLSRVANMIRNSQSFGGVYDINTEDFTTNCYQSYSGSGPTPTPVRYSSVSVTAFDGGETIISCPSGETTFISSSSATQEVTTSLTDEARVTVEEDSCNFYCIQPNPGDLPAIIIEFNLISKKDNNVNSLFRTTVSPRNFNR